MKHINISVLVAIPVLGFLAFVVSMTTRPNLVLRDRHRLPLESASPQLRSAVHTRIDSRTMRNGNIGATEGVDGVILSSSMISRNATAFSEPSDPLVFSKSKITVARMHPNAGQQPVTASAIPQHRAVTVMHAPAVWVEIPDSPHLTQQQQSEIQTAAEALNQAIIEPAPDSDAAEDRMSDAAAILASDADFRRKYGQHAWMQHHIQAHHLGLKPGTSTIP